MYRNVYLECYKSAMNQQQNNVELLICHFNYAYVAMGSILNDIEYAVGKLLASQNSGDKAKQQQQIETIQAREKLFDRSKKVIQAFDVAPPPRESLVRGSKEKSRASQPREQSPQESKQHLGPTIQFQELFKLNTKPNPNLTSTGQKIDSKGKSSSKNPPQVSSKTTPTPGQDQDDILQHLFKKK